MSCAGWRSRSMPRRAGTVAAPPHVVDLGCGVGASLCYLAGLLPITGTGVTLSPIQVQAARKRIESEGLSGRVDCIEGDYADLPTDAGRRRGLRDRVVRPRPDPRASSRSRPPRPAGRRPGDLRRRPASREQSSRPSGDPALPTWLARQLAARSRRAAVLAGEAGFEHESTEDLGVPRARRPRDRAIAPRLRSSAGSRSNERLRPSGRRQRVAAEPGRRWIGYDLMVFSRGV